MISCRPRKIVSLKSFALDNPTTGLGGALLNLIYVSQDCTTFSMIALNPFPAGLFYVR